VGSANAFSVSLPPALELAALTRHSRASAHAGKRTAFDVRELQLRIDVPRRERSPCVKNLDEIMTISKNDLRKKSNEFMKQAHGMTNPGGA